MFAAQRGLCTPRKKVNPMSRRVEDPFKTQVGAQASRINDLLLKHSDREWTVSDVAAMLPSVKRSAISGHFQRLAGEDDYRGKFLIRVRRGGYKINPARLPK